MDLELATGCYSTVGGGNAILHQVINQQLVVVRGPFGKPSSAEDEYEITRVFESDRGRIVNSAAIRRLQQKTQVFPLERNAVCSRLTHSLEVQQVGRYIAKEILNRFKQDKSHSLYGLINCLILLKAL